LPEGDTIHKLAARLGPVLAGRRIEGLFLRARGWVRHLRGARIGKIEALGKHLLIPLGLEDPGLQDPRWVVHVHLGMRGRWHGYALGAPWDRPRSQASVVLQAGGRVWVCFRARVAQVVRRVEVSALPGLRSLGPDLLAPDFRAEAAALRAQRLAFGTAAELLLDQRIACGLGNVYKSEVLFLERVHPRTSARLLDEATLVALFERGQRLMAANLGGWRRTTLRPVTAETAPRPGEPRFWVYERAGSPCWRCRTRVEWVRSGDDARPTYWCPACQSPEPAGVDALAGSPGAQR
jgi:endonuclease-8